jgi:RHS repeat-associated protein
MQLAGTTGVYAIFTIQNETEQMHYVLKDHQGSLTGLANASGQLSERYSYDAFGRRRNANTWDYDQVAGSTITARGYTFHEHMDAFGLINMNGRVYDPLVGQMLSPDPFIQQPEYSQSYNRYGYVLDNPLRFVDPSGYFAEGDSTGKAQGSSESILLHLERKKQQEERLSYSTDESRQGPSENQIQVMEGGGGAANGVGPFLENPNDPFIDAELSIKIGAAFSQKLKILGLGAHSGDTDPHSGILTPYNRSVSQRA